MSSFLMEQARQGYERRRGIDRLYDDRAGSCAALLWRHFASDLGDARRYREMVEWAEKVDAAAYSSVEEAILGDAPALRISFSLGRGTSQEYCEYLVRQLRCGTLQEVAALPEVSKRYGEGRKRIEAGLQFMEARKNNPDESGAVWLESDGIAMFRLQPPDEVTISRYAPYYFFPEARYSLGMARSKKGTYITAMRNPWREFQSIPLGRIFEKFTGGGHERVGSVFLRGDNVEEATEVLNNLLREMRVMMRAPATDQVLA